MGAEAQYGETKPSVSVRAEPSGKTNLAANHGCQMAIAGFLDPSCLALRAPGQWLRYATLENWIPSFPWIAPPHPPPWRNLRKGRDPILPSGNLAANLERGKEDLWGPFSDPRCIYSGGR